MTEQLHDQQSEQPPIRFQAECDELFTEIGQRLEQMSEGQYRVYAELISVESGIEAGIQNPDNPAAEWYELRNRAHGLLEAVKRNPPRNNRGYNSFNEDGLSPEDVQEEQAA